MIVNRKNKIENSCLGKCIFKLVKVEELENSPISKDVIARIRKI